MGSVNEILQANNTTRMKRAEYDAAVMLQTASNRREVARTTLADFSRSLQNVMRVEAAGKQYNEAASELAASLESRTTGNLNSSLAASERMGALAAQASAVGVGGTSVDLLSSTIELQRNIDQDMQNQATERMAKSGARSNAQIMDNAHSSRDLGREFGSFDYTVHIAPKPMKRRLGKLIGVAVATYFGGPQAGQAVADLAVGSWKAQNGDLAGMTKSYDSAARNVADGWSDWFPGKDPGEKNAHADKGDSGMTWGAYEPGEESLFGSGFGFNWKN